MSRGHTHDLAKVIEAAWGDPTWDGETLRPVDRKIADAVLGAGYIPPLALVQTASDLESLAVGTVVLTEQGGIWQAVMRDRFSLLWYEPGHAGLGARAADLSLPARVIYTPVHADGSIGA